MQERVASRAFALNNKLYLNEGEEVPADVGNATVIYLKPKQFVDRNNQNYLFFSAFQPDVLFKEL